MIKTAGNAFDPDDKYIYFLASNPNQMTDGSMNANDYALLAVNELPSDGAIKMFEDSLKDGKIVLIDSGIFSLAMEHAEKHGVTHNDALNMAPDEIDGFPQLLERYLSVIDKYGDKSWGYIELDQGGRENKIKTRKMLEEKGLRPIPVYHPFGDGWDYFDYLAERYDRICFGNVVQADVNTRKRLVATAWERKRKHPHLWIHLLGVTPNQWLNAYPIDSADSSSWLSSVRWSGCITEAGGKGFGGMDINYRYRLASHDDGVYGYEKAKNMAAYGSALKQRNWRNHLSDLESAGLDLLPGDTNG